MPQNVIPMPVPLVGQPIEVLGWTLILNVRCKCETGGFVALTVQQTPIGGASQLGICPSCARGLRVVGMNTNQTGQLEFSVDYGEPMPRVPGGAAS